ncbi:MAG: hypothetical protein U0984_11635 [Prosthecobacter sp.]|nr:hypothetical protein [Prosthecobacter sp.]
MFSRILLCFLALIPIWVLGFIHLPHPFDGDQALFMVGAKHLEDGGRLYVDFWDNKQPGIYLFYWLAGKLFGFNEVGAHALELIWYSILAVAMTLGLRSYFRRPWLAAFVPLASIGLFYGMADKWHLTQVEALASLPLFGCLILSTDLDATGRWHFGRWFLAGLCAGVLVTFKLALAPLAMMIWIVAIVARLIVDRGRAWRPVFGGLAGAFLGGVVMLGIVAAGFAWHGSLHEMVWTTFAYPMEALETAAAAPYSRLMGSIAWFTANTLPVLGLALLAVVAWRGTRREVLTLALLGWVVMACGVIWIQRWSWWQYHFCLLLVPLGILAVRGVDALLPNELWRNSRWKDCLAAVALACLLLGPALPGLGLKALAFGQEAQRHTAWQHDYQRAIDATERRIWRATGFLRSEAEETKTEPAPIYVFGNPLYLYLAERRQAMAEHGWSWETYLPSQWAALPEKLRAAKPAWLFIDPNYGGLIDDRSPETRQVIDDLYEMSSVSPDGIWLQLKSDASATR